MNIVGLDIETTGLDPDKHQILSIGACTIGENGDPKDIFYRKIEHNDYLISPQAMRVNGIDIRLWFGKDMVTTISNFSEWLISQYGSTEPIHALGYNVGSFDVQFLKRQYRDLYPFHYRSIDLNSCLMLLGIEKVSIDNEGILNAFLEKNVEFNDKLSKIIGYKPCLHNAACDAVVNALVWKMLLEKAKKGK